VPSHHLCVLVNWHLVRASFLCVCVHSLFCCDSFGNLCMVTQLFIFGLLTNDIASGFL
jgi:hypothetical protein